jgi:ADP-ribose pyrophosphatase YjhB (NUDIX family)
VALHFENKYSHCPSCGGELRPRVIKGGDPSRLVCGDCEFIYFQNPKVASSAIVMHDDRLVLLRRSIEPGFGKWVFPGGYVDLGERVIDAACREAREEACVEIEIERLLNVYSYAERPVVVVVYVGRVVGGEPAAGDECSEMRLFAPDEIPWADLAFPSTRDALRDFLALRKS